MRSHSFFCDVLGRSTLAQKQPGPPNEAVALHGAGWFMCAARLPKTPLRPIKCRSNCKVEHMAKVAFLGLGVMGFPMAGHLVKKGGHEVTVYNRTGAKA